MPLPQNLGESPVKILEKIDEFFFLGADQLVPQFYLQLAKVNRKFHTAYMSDRVWAKIDVYRVKTNIAAHFFFNSKAIMSREESEFCGKFDFGKWRHPAITVEQFANFSLYTPGNILAESLSFHLPDFKDQFDNRDLLFYAARSMNGLAHATETLRGDAAL